MDDRSGLRIEKAMKIRTASESQFLKRRWLLVFWLLPILAVWYFLIFYVPITNFGLSCRRNVAPSLPNRTLTIQLDGMQGNWHQTLTFDPSSGRLFADPKPFSRPGEEFLLRYLNETTSKNGEFFRRWKLSILNPETGVVDSQLEFDFPSGKYPCVVGKRFAVFATKDILHVSDLHSSDTTPIEYPAKGVDGNSWKLPTIGNTNNFIFVNKIIPPDPVTLLPQVGIELFGINDEGVPGLVNSWIAAPFGNDSFALLGDQLMTVNPATRLFEFRSAVDGRLISSPPLPSELDLATDVFYINDGRLTIPIKSKTYSLKELRWLNNPRGANGIYLESPDKSLFLWQGSEWVVTESDSGKELSRFGWGREFSFVNFLDNETIIFCSPRWGYTFRTVSARTGKTIMIRRIYWWVVPLLLLAVTAYLVWSILWLRTADASNGWVWGDIAWISGLPMVALAVRFAFVGDPLDIDRCPCHLNQGIFLALMFVSCIWLWSGQQSIVRRALPLLLSLATLAAVLVAVFTNHLGTASRGLLSALVILIPVFTICVLLRICGFRLRQNSALPSTKEFKNSLKELFILVAVFALLFAPLRLIVPDLMKIEKAFLPWFHLSLVSLSPALAWFLAMAQKRMLFWVGGWLSLAMFSYLLFDVLYYFVQGNWFCRFWNLWDVSLHVATFAFVTTFLVTQAFRHRGWRWERS